MSEKEPSIGDITKLMLFFGRVPETHLKSLQAFPFIFFNDVSKAELDYGVATKKEDGETVFTYDLTLKPESNDQMEKRYKAFESAVRNLFWKEACLILKIDGKEVYKSE